MLTTPEQRDKHAILSKLYGDEDIADLTEVRANFSDLRTGEHRLYVNHYILLTAAEVRELKGHA
jgi:hypothetical protein